MHLRLASKITSGKNNGYWRANIMVILLLSIGWYGCKNALNHNRPPTITSPTTASAIVDLPFSYEASAEDPNHDAIEFAYSSLPDWLAADGKTVRGIPATTGTYHFNLQVKDAESESDRITVTIEVRSNTNLIESIVAAVSLDSLLAVVNKLTGNSMIVLPDESYFVKTRLTYFEGNELAAKYLEWKLGRFGLLTGRHDFSTRGSNVLALQQGSVFPDSIYIIGAHYDCQVISTEPRPQDIRDAPGADNNASGVAAVLEAARILSQYATRYSILYVLWDEHENVPEDIDQSGLLGSIAYSEHTLACDMRIAGVIDMDMIAYDHDDNRIMYIHGSTQGRSTWMINQAVDMIDQFTLNLDPRITMEGLGSDNVPFHDCGYSTIGFSEDISRHGTNFYNYQNRDTIDKFNLDYYHQMTRMIIATLAFLAGVESLGNPPVTTFWFCV
jgi:hypothetical protein